MSTLERKQMGAVPAQSWQVAPDEVDMTRPALPPRPLAAPVPGDILTAAGGAVILPSSW